MKRAFIGLMAAALSIGMLSACSGDDSGDAANGEAAESIKIGVNYELSGGVATYGQANVDGIKMAIDEINAAGGVDGKQVELVQYDNKSEPAEATTLATKMMTQDGILAAIGPATSGSFKATIPVANQNKVPVVSGSATADDVTVGPSGVQEYAFRTCFSDSYQGEAAAAYALENLGATNAVIIKDNSSDYGKGLAETFTSRFTEGGGTIVAEEAYVTNDTDFNSILTRVRGQQFDVIYIPGYYNEAGLIIKQARDLGIDAPILGADGFDSPTLLELAGPDALNDVYFTNHYSSLDQDPAVQDFIAAFQEEYGQEPNAFHALGYDTAKFVVDAIGRAAELTPEAVKDALASTEGFTGVTGTISVDENHNAVKSIVVIRLENGVQSSSEKVDA
ncbi:MAG TPA: ABC transporter substrate-binding protein [Actinomycetaceae bacterium]|nr:ABC transporter substrate-binding protein [Actinomycetaceae bacterium]